MKVTLQTSTGIDIQLQPARFQTIRGNINGNPADAEAAPAAPVGAGLMDAVARAGNVPTATALLTLSRSSMGVLYACCSGNLAVLVFDLGEPEVRTWLDTARRTGHLPVVLAGGGRAKLVRVPLDEDIERLAERAIDCAPANADDLTTALQAVVAQIEDGEVLASWGVDIARLKQGSVSLLTPTHALTRASQPVH